MTDINELAAEMLEYAAVDSIEPPLTEAWLTWRKRVYHRQHAKTTDPTRLADLDAQ